MAEATVANVNQTGPLAKLNGLSAQFKEYVADLRGEMQRVTWPSWNQVRATTAVVIAAVFGFAAYFAIVDLLLGRGISRLFNVLAK